MATKQATTSFSIFGSPFLWMAVIAIATFISYIPALDGQFTNWDDMVYIGGNPYITSLSAKNISAIFSTNYMGNYHPLAMLSLAVDYQLSGLNPFVFHLSNILIHILNSILVLVVVKQLTKRLEIGVIAGLLFGVHALHVESVTWISERKDVLYAFFYLLSLSAYIRYVQKRDMKWLGIAFLMFLLSCLSKGQAVSLALSLFLVDIFMERKWTDIKVLAEKIPFLLLALVFGMVAINAQEGADATIMANFPGRQRIAFASYGLVMYIVKLLFPVGLSAYYPYPIIGGVGEVPVMYWLCVLPALAFVAIVIFSWKRSKPLFFGLAFFLANIALLLQLLPVGRAIMADRYAYIPSIGYVFLAGYYLSDRKLIRIDKVAWAIVAVYTIVLMALTFERNKVWLNSDTLWSDVIEKNPRVPVAWYNRGNVKMDSLKYKEAIEDYNECLNVDPGFWKAYINRGTAKTKTKDYIGAIADFDAMLRIDSMSANAYINRGLARRMVQDYGNALKDYDVAARLKPDQPELYASRANVKLDMKDYEGAISDFDLALKLNPQYTTAITNRAIVKKAKNDLTGALADYDAAIALDATNSEFYNNRGNLKFQLKDTEGAIADYSTSIRLKPDDYLGYKNRAAVYFSTKRYTEALADLAAGIKLNPKSGELFYTRSLVKKELKDTEGSRADFKQAVTLDPGYASSGYMKSLGVDQKDLPGLQPTQLNEQGFLLEGQGKVQEAIELYKKAIELKPDYPEAWYNLGNCYGKTRRFNEAMDCMNKAISLKPNYVQALASRGIAFASTGKADLAIKDLSAAIKEDPKFALAYFNRALVYLNSGKKEPACVDLQAAVKLGYNPAYPIFQKECQGKQPLK